MKKSTVAFLLSAAALPVIVSRRKKAKETERQQLAKAVKTAFIKKDYEIAADAFKKNHKIVAKKRNDDGEYVILIFEIHSSKKDAFGMYNYLLYDAADIAVIGADYIKVNNLPSPDENKAPRYVYGKLKKKSYFIGIGSDEDRNEIEEIANEIGYGEE